ncbi:MAG: DUF2267 domain-containing protein [Anaerolineaceae bacterium]|nr:MAG: DUF2267 domain-containing protein [Anaerolineaceae bacterium]
MTQANGSDLSGYYQQIQENGRLPTVDVAQRWNEAVLRTLSLNLDRRTKKRLGKALPDELAYFLSRTFWLVHFRDGNKSEQEFLKEVARRSGSTDPKFALLPTTAVFHELKAYTGDEISDAVADSLAPELSELWQKA